MRRTRALTLIESLAALTIAVVTISFLTPAFARAMRAHRESVSMARLRQLHLGLMLYRSENDPGDFGSAATMGLPTVEQLLLRSGSQLGLPPDAWKSACGTHPDSPLGFTNYNYYPDNDATWARYAEMRREAAVILSDFNCNPSTLRMSSTFELKTVTAVRFGGSAVKLTRYGSPTEYWTWFHED